MSTNTPPYENVLNMPPPNNQPPNLNHQIAMAESLYKLFLQAKNDVNDIGTELNNLKIKGQKALIQEYMGHLELNHIEPRLEQFRKIYINIENYDLPTIKAMIDALNEMAHGFSGVAQSTQFYNFAAINITANISSMNSSLINANLYDFCTQKEAFESFRKTLLDIVDAMNQFGRQLRDNIESHSGMFLQHFTPFYQNNATPRLEELKTIWIAIQNEDIPVVEQIIQKIPCQ